MNQLGEVDNITYAKIHFIPGIQTFHIKGTLLNELKVCYFQPFLYITKFVRCIA